MRKIKIIGVVALCGTLSQPAAAAVIRVPLDQPTIQLAVDSSQSGDTIAVEPGRYHEEILIRDKQVQLIGAGSDSSVIDGTGSDTSSLRITGVAARSTLVRGFTFEGAHCAERGAILISDSASARIEYCCFTDIEAEVGGAIWVEGSWDTTRVLHNRFHGIKSPYRGAAVTGTEASLSIVGNLIYDNEGSTALSFSQSAAISVHRCSTEIRSNTIASNQFAGSAIYSLRAHLEEPGSHSTILDNVIASNGSGYGILLVNGQGHQIQYNDVWNHGMGSFDCAGCVGTFDATNISVDPQLSPPDYLPDSTSPVIGAGSGGGIMGIPNAVVACGGPASICGNGIHESGEGCDDGNPFSGDGCDPQCRCERTRGELNSDFRITSADIILLVYWVFWAEAQGCSELGDVNCSGKVTSSDIITLVNYVFKSGSAPCEPCPQFIEGTGKCPCASGTVFMDSSGGVR